MRDPENLLLPKYEPAVPKSAALTIKGKINAGKYPVEPILPVNPAMEFTRINRAETAEAVFVLAHPINITKGDKNIPPPVPVRPDKSPRPAPMLIDKGFEGA